MQRLVLQIVAKMLQNVANYGICNTFIGVIYNNLYYTKK